MSSQIKVFFTKFNHLHLQYESIITLKLIVDFKQEKMIIIGKYLTLTKN